jgi:hypothetical protein
MSPGFLPLSAWWSMDQLTGTIIAAGLPTLAVIAAFVRNESAQANLSGRIETLTRDMNARFETLTRDINGRFETLTRRLDAVDTDLREWAMITMLHYTEIARLKDKVGLSDQK